MLKKLVIAFCLFSSTAFGASYTTLQWGLDKTATPYNFGANLGGTWTNLGTLSSGGSWQIPMSNVSTSNATTWFDNAFCSTVGYIVARTTGAWVCSQYLPIRLTWLGADNTGVSDISSLLNTTISSIGTTGGIIQLDPGTYKVANTINLGNGSTSNGSTINNVVIEGLARPKIPPGIFGGFVTQTGGVTLNWTGGSSAVIAVNGPMQGWGLKNLYIEGNSNATSGIYISSGQFGKVENVTIANAIDGVLSTTVPHFGSFTLTDSIRNEFDNLMVVVPDIVGAAGVVLTGGTAKDSDTDYNTFTHLTIWMKGGTKATSGLYLTGADTNYFYSYMPIITSVNNTQLVFDYTYNSVWPTANFFFGIEPGTPVNFGTPAPTAQPNVFFGVAEANGNVYPTTLANTTSSLPQVITPRLAFTNQGAAIAQTQFLNNTNHLTGLYRLNYYLVVTTVGTAGNVLLQFFWGDDAQAQGSTVATVSATGKNFASGSLIVESQAMAGLSYAVPFSGITGSPKYSLYVTAERLQ